MAVLKISDSDAGTNEIQERVGTGGVGVNLDTSGGSGDYEYSIGYDPSGGGFKVNSSTGAIEVDDPTLIDYEALVDGKLTITIHVADTTDTENFGDINVVINVKNFVGDDDVDGTAAGETIDAGDGVTEEEDHIDGLAGNDIITALGGNDEAKGGADDDNIDGGSGDDFLYGEAGDDIIVGGAGDDFIVGGAAATVAGDNLDGGAGIDTLSYEDSSAGVTVDLDAGTGADGDAEDDVLVDFEKVIGSASDDKITGNNNFGDVIEGGASADTLDGLGEDPGTEFYILDTVSYAQSDAAVTLTLGKQGVATTGKGGHAEGDSVKNFENIFGSIFADKLTLTEAGDLEGGAGADTLTGSSDLTDSVSYTTSNAAVTVTLGKAGKQSAGSGGDAQGDKIIGFEQINGSNFNDRLTGNELDNALLGGYGSDTLTGGDGDDNLFGDNFIFQFGVGNFSQHGGNDTIDGGNGDDFLQGGIGSDTIKGGTGIDTASYLGSTAAVTIALGAKGAVTTQTGGDAAGDKLSLVENIVGTDFDDVLTGNEQDNLFEGGDGEDAIDGGGGSDTISYASAGSSVTVDLSLAAQVGTSDEDGDELVDVENIIGSGFDDELTGDGNANIIEGGAGADTMDGGGGDDIVSYETYENFADTGVIVALDVNGDIDVTGNVGNDADGDVGTDFNGIIGSAYNDVLTGNSSNNVLIGLDGDDTIAGGGGNDTFDGGDGVDTLDYSAAAGTVTLTLGAAGKTTVVTAAVDGEDSIVNFENVIGTALADTLNGNTLNNVFQGLGGADVIDGNGGIDTVDYSDAGSGVNVELGSGSAVKDVSGGDTDKISEIENVVGSGFDDKIVGNALANRLEGGNGADEITGGAGADTLIGGGGNDTFKFTGTEGIGDTIDGGAGAGDRIEIGGSVAATLENFSATNGSIEEFDGGGNAIVGTAKVNTLDFSGLTAYSGVTYVDGLAGNDRIKAFAGASATFFGGAGDDSLTGGNLGDTLDGGDGEDGLVGGAGEDTLIGGKAEDTLRGDGDNDTLIGGAGGDTVDGGAGDDTFVIAGTDAIDDTIIGGGDDDTIEVETATVTFKNFNAAASSIEFFSGATDESTILGTADGDVLNFAGTVMDDIDAIEGGAGNDTIVASDSGDVTLRGGDGADIITGGAGADRIEGGKGKDTIQGAGGDDTIVISGTDAQFDTIDGGGGAENTISVTGSAAVTLAAFNATASSIHTWNGNGKHVIGDGNNNVLNFAGLTTIEGSGILYIDGAAGDDTIVGTDIDTNDLRGGAGNDDLTGGALQDTLNGGAGADDISAGAENDTIVITGAEAESDTIDGGAGDDTILVTGSAAVTLDAFDATASSVEFWFGNKKGVLGNDEANVFDFSGLDNPANIGVIDGGDGNDDITGSDEVDEIRGGTGDDTLDGFDGNDTLNGGIGADDISGGAGNDTIVISGTEGASDTLDGGADTDTLSLTSATVTLKNFDATASLIEQLQGKNTALRGDGDNNSFDLSGLAAVSGLKSVDGGTGNDIIIGVDLDTYSDDLRGNSGIDRLTGGKGDDKLAGGSDDDTFVFDTTDFDHDTIADFGSGFDVIEFDTAVFADFTAVQDAMEQVGDDTVITLDADNTITLTDVVASQLTTNDFTFV